ncbi:Lipase (class 3) [Nitrosomonas marina]|uniref:Lipase (Class 3) n=1 Tax=Nitrosomonas marina TaxID=917 RepID=A0A1H9Z2I7_9PROT|nr:lipase family protein [Nitrosomonas marina]SES75223.1 Lipase (class 3) [Nitrosomonas marina]
MRVQRSVFSIIALILSVGYGCNMQQNNVVSQVPDVEKNIDFNTIKWYAARAGAAYDSEAEIKATFPDTVRVAQVGSTQVQYFLEFDTARKIQIVTIRGTANLKNIIEDVEYIESKNDRLGIHVHKGFDEDTFKIYQDILPFLKKDYAVRLTGHSLGAAIATLLMIYLHEDGFEIQRLVNFGQPKFTNKQGVERYHTLPLTRIVDENDVVPLLPPATLVNALHGGYEHMGDEVILLKGEEYIYLEQHQADTKKVEGFWNNLDHESIKEHLIANYLKNINSKLAKAEQVPYAARDVYLDRHAD